MLIIEDDVEIIKYIGKLIEQQYHIYYAFDGNTGLQLALEKEPDIIISDVMMPQMNGFELCEKIKNRSPTQPYTHYIAHGTIEYR